MAEPTTFFFNQHQHLLLISTYMAGPFCSFCDLTRFMGAFMGWLSVRVFFLFVLFLLLAHSWPLCFFFSSLFLFSSLSFSSLFLSFSLSLSCSVACYVSSRLRLRRASLLNASPSPSPRASVTRSNPRTLCFGARALSILFHFCYSLSW